MSKDFRGAKNDHSIADIMLVRPGPADATGFTVCRLLDMHCVCIKLMHWWSSWLKPVHTAEQT